MFFFFRSHSSPFWVLLAPAFTVRKHLYNIKMCIQYSGSGQTAVHEIFERLFAALQWHRNEQKKVGNRTEREEDGGIN